MAMRMYHGSVQVAFLQLLGGLKGRSSTKTRNIAPKRSGTRRPL